MNDNRVLEERLAQAQLYVTEGERHVAEQERRVAELRDDGHNISQAGSLLELFRETHAQHVAHRDFILREMDGAPEGVKSTDRLKV